jgi:two-component system, cell cycle response regulator
MWRDRIPAAPARSVLSATALVLLGLVGLVFVDSLLHVTSSSVGAHLHRIGYVGGTAMAAALIAARVALVRTDRAPWLLIAIGLGLFACGDVYYVSVLVPDPTPPYPNLGDLMYLPGYAFLIAGVAVALAERLRQPSLAMWLDAAIGVIAVLTFGLAALLEPIAASSGSTLEVVVNVAYPTADLILMGMIMAVISLTGARLDRSLGGIVLALTALTIADVCFLRMSLAGTWQNGGIPELFWPLSSALFGIAAWTRLKRTRMVPLSGMRAMVLPSVFALAIIGFELFGPAVRLAQLVGGAGLILVVCRMLIGVRENMRLAERLSLDPLTGLGNRGQLSADLSRVMAFHRTHTLLLADLDGFKLYNDAFGHPAGDAMLRRLTSALSGAVGAAHAYRIGGDEFCVILEGDLAGTDALRDAVTFALTERGAGFRVGVSLGAVEIPRESSNPEEAIQIADQRMYATKDDRRDSRRSQDARAVLIEAQRERTPDLGEHVDCVAKLATQVGEAIGLLPGEVVMLERAAELHDIGKIAIPDGILAKCGPLDNAEWEFTRQHTILGERILGSADSLAPVARIVRSTHERVDGRGYPDRLAGDEIPLASRIIFACDSYNAMTSNRPYSNPRTQEQAIRELERCAGSQFDRKVIAALIGILTGSAAKKRVPREAPRRGVLIPSTSTSSSI